MQDHPDRRAQDRELARVLRFIDGDGARLGAETRLDRGERQIIELMELRQIVKVLTAHAEGHPLLDKAIARRVVDHMESAESHGRAAKAVGIFMGRSVLDIVLRVIELAVLAYVASRITIGGLH